MSYSEGLLARLVRLERKIASSKTYKIRHLWLCALTDEFPPSSVFQKEKIWLLSIIFFMLQFGLLLLSSWNRRALEVGQLELENSAGRGLDCQKFNLRKNWFLSIVFSCCSLACWRWAVGSEEQLKLASWSCKTYGHFRLNSSQIRSNFEYFHCNWLKL